MRQARESLVGSLAPHVKRPLPPGDEWQKARDTAWGVAAANKIKGVVSRRTIPQ